MRKERTMTPEALSEEALLKRRDEIERSLRKKFKSDIFGKFVKAIVDYEPDGHAF